jgi:hypothetical protein
MRMEGNPPWAENTLGISTLPLSQYFPIDSAHAIGVFHETPNAPKIEMGKRCLLRKGVTMKSAVVAATLLALVFTGSGFAAESKKSTEMPTTALEQRKAQILMDLDQRIKRLQQEKDCVKAAKSEDALNGCGKKQGISSGKKAVPSQVGKAPPGAKGGQAKSPAPGVPPEPDEEPAE